MNLNKLEWIYSRLKAMSFQEIIWRVSQKTLTLKEVIKYKGCRYIIEPNLINRNICVSNVKDIDLNRFYILYNEDFRRRYSNKNQSGIEDAKNIAESICDKRINIIGCKTIQFENNINWFAGINTNQNWPVIFSHYIDFRQSDGIGDIRFIWDINRHYHFVLLAKAFFLTMDDKYFNELSNQFYDWVNKNPFLYGVNWISTMEIAIRVYSWLWCLILLYSKGFDQNRVIITDLYNAILNSINYVTMHFSLFSSANNHLIVEAAITGIVGIVFNNIQWVETASGILKQELQLQVSNDGVNKEQAIHYQAFVMEALNLFIFLLRKNNIEYPSIIDKRQIKLNQFCSDMINRENSMPSIGDSDDGCILNMMGNHYNYYEYILQFSSLLYNKQFIELKKLNENLLWLFDKNVIYLWPDSKYDNKNSKVYINGGYSIFKYKDEKKERILTFDHSELGYGSLAAHGHADLLSITLSVDGRDIFIDPGTYIYNIEKNWRDYFRKTINHNTVEINGKDQSEIKGAFLWGDKPRSVLEGFKLSHEFDIAAASYIDYEYIKHERIVVFLKPDLYIIKDDIIGNPIKWVLTYMIDSNVNVTIEKRNYIKLRSGSNIISMLFSGIDHIRIDEEYESKYFGSKTNTKSIRAAGEANIKREILTFICINNNVSIIENDKELKFEYRNLLYSLEKGNLNIVGEI